jgi:hypothetical protein
VKQLLIVGFRGFGKSTDGSLALPLWAALEKPEQYPFIILVSDSTRQATLNITGIKNELETNALIKQDYGEIKGSVIEDFSLKGDGEEWQKQNIVLSSVSLLDRADRRCEACVISNTGPNLLSLMTRKMAVGFARKKTATRQNAGFAPRS